MKTLIFISAFYMGAVSAMPQPRTEGPMLDLASLRARDEQLDTALRFIGLKTLKETAAAHGAKQIFRLIASSSWGTDVFSVLKVGQSELRFDGLKAPSGYLLILDRAVWENTDIIFSGSRTVRMLTMEQAESIEAAMSAEQVARLTTELRGIDSSNAVPIDGGPTIIEWFDGEKEKTLSHIPSSKPSSDSPLLGRLVTVYYALIK